MTSQQSVSMTATPNDAPPAEAVFETDVPARLDRLPWSRFHWLVVIALACCVTPPPYFFRIC